MLFESGKMNQITFQNEGRHLIFDCFFRVWCRSSDRQSYLFQNPLNIMREARDVFIDILRCCLSSLHVSPFVIPENILNRPTDRS